jgi:cytochrome c-type biogenesis protein
VTELTLLGLAIAFTGGVVSFASPCCLPLVPAYLSYMVGATSGGTATRRQALMHGLAFTLGFTAVFVAFWASIGAIGYVLADNARYLRQLAGGLLIFLGLQTAGVINIGLLWRDTRPLASLTTVGVLGGGAGSGTAGGAGTAGAFGVGGQAAALPSYRRSLLFGTFFAAGWSPCIGPILGGIIGLASVSASVAAGTALLLAYAAGLAVPFLAVAIGASWVAVRLAWVGRHHHAISIATGWLLVALGALMVTNTLSRLAALSTPLFG